MRPATTTTSRLIQPLQLNLLTSREDRQSWEIASRHRLLPPVKGPSNTDPRSLTLLKGKVARRDRRPIIQGGRINSRHIMRGSSSSRIRGVREAVGRDSMRKKVASSSRTSIVRNNIKRVRSLSMIGIIKDIMRQRGKTPSSNNIGQGPRSKSITNRSTESKKDTKKHLSLSSKGIIMKITKDQQKNTTTTTMRLSRHLPPA